MFNLRLGLAALLAIACGGDPDLDPSPGPEGPARQRPTAEPDYGAWLFDPNQITTVDITMDPAAWDELRAQTRNFFATLAGDCQAQPFDKPWTTFEVDVAINGITVESVGVRKKGFIGSLSSTKPSLKIDFDAFIPGQRFASLSRLTLNNQRQDPSLINACLGYGVFRDAGVVAPRCNFALVSVNGDSLGIYAHVDSVKKQFVAQHFDDYEGNLYEGTIADFRDGWTGPFELKTNENGPAPTDVAEIAAALTLPDSELLAAVGAIIDLDRFYTFWAMETLLGHWDGYSGNTNNFYFYREPSTGLVEFIPWGADALFRQRFTPYASVQAAGVLTRRLYLHPEGQAAYLARVAELALSVWDAPTLIAEVDRMAALVRPHVIDVAQAAFDAEIQGTRDFINGRQAAVTNELALGPPQWTAQLRPDFCFDRVGDVTLTVDTLWNAGQENLGSGSANVNFPGLTQSIINVASLAMPVGASAALFVRLDLDDGTQLLFIMTMPPSEVRPGGSAPLDWVAATGELYVTPPGGSQTLLSRLAKGSITVTTGATTDLAPVVLSLSADLHALNL